MSDRFATEITIGGNIGADKVKDLYEVCKNEGVGFEWTEGLGSIDEFIAQIKKDGNLTVNDPEVAGGSFDDLEEFCRDNQLSYCRHSDAKYEYDGTLEWWKAGMDGPKDCLASQDQHALIHADTIKELLKDGTAEEKVAKIVKALKEETPPEIPPLTIVAPVSPQNPFTQFN